MLRDGSGCQCCCQPQNWKGLVRRGANHSHGLEGQDLSLMWQCPLSCATWNQLLSSTPMCFRSFSLHPSTVAYFHEQVFAEVPEISFWQVRVIHTGNMANPSQSLGNHHILKYLLHYKSPPHFSTGDVANALLLLKDSSFLVATLLLTHASAPYSNTLRAMARYHFLLVFRD